VHLDARTDTLGVNEMLRASVCNGWKADTWGHRPAQETQIIEVSATRH